MATSIGNNIKRLRTKINLTQDELARKADVKYTTLTKIESGIVKRPSVQIIAQIAKSLSVSIEDILKD
ncbi:MAG: helix-turn-helix transcriptional regulator [Candidatus Margulisbacteria bacterium]|nr:helix-turn-helix transcriptional regulator [Candidatus Margulisiibacteriota bacterium]